MNLYCYMIIES